MLNSNRTNMLCRSQKETSQIIDVNINRFSEALKVIEDIVRFKLNDVIVTDKIRKLKLKLWQNLGKIRRKFILARQSKKDIGRESQFDRTKRDNLSDVLFVNIKRSQESARILEEIFKINYPKISAVFKEMRFFLYDLEKEICARLSKDFIPSIYVILNIETIGRKYLKEITKTLVASGVTMLQLREAKQTLTVQWLKDAKTIKDAIENKKVKLIINDRIDIALAIDADGVHLGKDDMPISIARKILGDEKIIGKTTRNTTQAKRAEKEGADYVSVGAIFPSLTKPTAPVVGIKQLKSVLKAVKIPVIAIGGITPERAKRLDKLGIAGVAIASSVFQGINYILSNKSHKVKI